MVAPLETEHISLNNDFLTLQEQTVCKQITKGEAPYSQHALALLALQTGSTQAQAAQQSGLTQGQVKYWLSQFRKKRLAIFPESVLNGPRSKTKREVEKADSSGKKNKKSEEKTLKVEKEKKGKKSKKSEKKAGKSKKEQKEKKGKKKKKGKKDKGKSK